MKLSFFKILGPGLLYAGAAVGVSHLVQSTRAGATFGFSMLAIVLLANILKFPFFEAAPRYAAATGNHLLTGYRNLGKWAVALFLLMTLSTMFIIQAAVTIVTAGLAQQLFDTPLETQWVGVLILMICIAILSIGKYAVLEKIMKWMILLLSITALLTAILSFFTVDTTTTISKEAFDFSNKTHLAFLIAFVGWMPAPIDISVWHSMWALVKRKEKKQLLTDFHVGYWGTAVLALLFVLLGKNILFGSDVELASGATQFAGQLIGIFTAALGSWSFPIIAIAAFTTMFSTTLTVLDGLSRVMVPTVQLLKSDPSVPSTSDVKKQYTMWLLITGIGAALILLFLLTNMRALVDIATTVSFLTAPVFAFLNYKVMQSGEVAKTFQFSTFTKVVAIIGLSLLILTSFYFIYLQF